MHLLPLVGFFMLPCATEAGGPLSFSLYRREEAPGEQSFETVDAPLRRLPSMTYITVQLGSPPQPIDVQIDTGSSDLVVPGINCQACDDASGFQCNQSHTCRVPHCHVHPHKSKPCPFRMSYGSGGTTTGHVINDVLTLAVHGGTGAISSPVYFDLMRDCQPYGLFSHHHYSGILGLGPDSGTGNRFPSPLTMIMRAHALPNVFAMYTGSDKNSGGGVLTIGGVDQRIFTGKMRYIPMAAKGCELWDYCVDVEGISVGPHFVANGPKARFGVVLVDSGTTKTFLPPDVFEDVRHALQHENCHLPMMCHPNGRTLFDGQCIIAQSLPFGYPTLHWHLHGGLKVDVAPEVYFLKKPHNDTFYSFCLGIKGLKHSPGNPDTYLGDTFMAAAYVVFDREQRRMGFATPVMFPLSHLDGGAPSYRARIWIAIGFNVAIFYAAAYLMSRAFLRRAWAAPEAQPPVKDVKAYGALWPVEPANHPRSSRGF